MIRNRHNLHHNLHHAEPTASRPRADRVVQVVGEWCRYGAGMVQVGNKRIRHMYAENADVWCKCSKLL